MPRQKSIITVIRELVQTEVQSAITSLFGSLSPKKPPKNGRRRRRRRGPGRPPGSKKKRRTTE